MSYGVSGNHGAPGATGAHGHHGSEGSTGENYMQNSLCKLGYIFCFFKYFFNVSMFSCFIKVRYSVHIESNKALSRSERVVSNSLPGAFWYELACTQ